MSGIACRGGRDGIRPLLDRERRVVVDGHPICSECGRAVEQTGADRWSHASASKRPVRITLSRIRACGTFAAFQAAFPSIACSEDDWREASLRLEEFHARLARAARQRGLAEDDNPYLDLVERLGGGRAGWALTRGLARILDLPERRRELASLFAWAIPTDSAIALLGRYAPLVECGAGRGYWSALLRARGIEVAAYDSAPPGGRARRNEYHRGARPPWTEVRRASSRQAARRHPDRSLFLCWPPFDDDEASYGALRAYRGGVLIHIGEPDVGATGSVRFHRELRLNWTLVETLELPHWPRIADRVMVYRRNPRRRPLVERDRCFECRRFIPTGAFGRCDVCFERRPPAIALRVGRHRIEYPQEVVDAMAPALRKAFEQSPNRIRTGRRSR